MTYKKTYVKRLFSLYSSLMACIKKIIFKPIKPKKPKYVPKLYEKMLYPGQRVQADCKIFPKFCITGDAKVLDEFFVQYTAIDEYSRYRFLIGFREQNTYSSAIFVKELIKHFPFNIECVQTDNGLEFIKSFDNHKKVITHYLKNFTAFRY